MRLYIGIDLPPQVKQLLFQFQLRLKGLGVTGGWKAPEYFHITLEFLGELPPESIPMLEQIIEVVISDKKKFKLQIDKLGAFPSFHRPHTLWAGVAGNTTQLDELWSELHEQLERKGFVLQKAPFKPHITLLTRPKVLPPDLTSFPLRHTSFTLSEIILFESRVEEDRRVYPQLYHAVLKRNK